MKPIFLLVLLPLSFFAQKDTIDLTRRYELELYPRSLVVNETRAIAQEFQGSVFSKTNKLELNFGMSSVLFRELDRRSRSFKSIIKFPRLSNFQVQLGYGFLDKTNESKQKNHRFSGFFGIYGFQYGTYRSDYWIIDSIPDKGYLRINGIGFGSITHGIKYQITKRDKKERKYDFVKRHTLQLTYHVNVLTTLFVNSDDLKTKQIQSSYASSHHGLRFNYTFVRRLSNNFGLCIGTELFLTPSLKYTPIQKYWVPRGGEAIFPLFFQLKVGLRGFV